jgi:hypothetical protein
MVSSVGSEPGHSRPAELSDGRILFLHYLLKPERHSEVMNFSGPIEKNLVRPSFITERQAMGLP